ncbi:hypothetical protein OH76DRAFT_43853 [Lentinus brumalis]|uniref:Uncharacterized protein n=1 Tax=Lentinus brumalis TaxID=2498619 RepID=A0A371DY28_9APHY|nr:hypothetical protein OH76DRAFT_43853 [Polyporus brumalis]
MRSTKSFTLAKDAVKLDVADKTGPGGLIVLVGVSAEELPVSSLELIEWRTSVLSSLYGDRHGETCGRHRASRESERCSQWTEGGIVTGHKVVVPFAA